MNRFEELRPLLREMDKVVWMNDLYEFGEKVRNLGATTIAGVTLSVTGIAIETFGEGTHDLVSRLDGSDMTPVDVAGTAGAGIARSFEIFGTALKFGGPGIVAATALIGSGIMGFEYARNKLQARAD